MHEELTQLAYDMLQTNIPAEFIFQHLVAYAEETVVPSGNPFNVKAPAIRAATSAYKEAYDKASTEWKEQIRKRQEEQEKVMFASGGLSDGHFFIAPKLETQA